MTPTETRLDRLCDAERAKRDLPPVLIRWNGHTWTARVTGRLNRFASVSPYSRQRGKRIEIIMGPVFEYSWESVARAAYEGRVLIAD